MNRIMITGHSTDEGTAAYARRFAELPGNYRAMLGLSAASIGIGTYLGENDEATDAAYGEALRVALRGGINLIDTAVNYRFQRSERVIGKVIAELIGAGDVRREELIVATKGGYIAFDGEMPADPRRWFEETFVRTGIVGAGEVVQGSHCMTPRYLAAMIETSRQNLGLDCIDIYYVHNPETQLGAVSREEFRERLKRAFDLLESKVNEGRIRYYGLATWNGFRVKPSDRSYLSLSETLAIAQEVAGSGHHCRVIQMPYNLGMPEALTVANQTLLDGTKANMLAASDATGVAICASASLLQGQLTRGLPSVMSETFAGLDSDAQRALQFVRSTPGISVALCGMSSAAHVRHNLATAKHPPAAFETLMKLFQRADAG
jgi:aryl-alcohol dehydrogenase-like predicted oxidoreductase